MTLNDWTLMTLMHQGGWVMWALLVMSVVAVAVTIERAWVLYRHRTEVAPFLARLRRAVLSDGSVEDGIGLCEATRGPLAVVVKAGLLRFDEGREEMERGMEAAARFELRRLERRLAVLSTTANVAPLLGFLGTVTGMMASFGALVIYGTTNPALVAAGVNLATVISDLHHLLGHEDGEPSVEESRSETGCGCGSCDCA